MSNYMRKIVEQWAPRKAYIHWQLPTGSSDAWSPTNSVVARYITQLELLGLEDPTEATDFYDQALQFRKAYLDLASKQNDEIDLSERLVRGEISVDDATKQAAKAPAALDARQKLERQRQVISNAIAGSYSAAVRAVHNFGEHNWLNLLRPLVQDAYEVADQARWDQLHKFTALLRDPNLAGLALLVLAPSSSFEIEDTWRYTVGRPDLYDQWRRAHSIETHNIALVHVGPITYIANIVVKGPHPTLADIPPSWEPGLYSAGEVLAITNRILDEQEDAQTGVEIELSQEGRPA